MSLNGLDAVAVTEAYTGALGEAGGWLLLKYASRDSVEILTRGTGGAHEARAAIAAYPDKSPLYGFLLYRRRKVLIKYVPEGTSRLLQARVAVHFTAITDRFAPHDTTFSITTPDELNDAALTSACSLHTAAPSSSSSSSLSSRKHKLDGITEDVEDGQSTAGASESPSTARPSTANTVTKSTPSLIPATTADDDAIAEKEVAKDALGEDVPSKAAGEVTAGSDKAPAAADDILDKLELIRTETAPGPESSKRYDALFQDGPDPRLSSQTTRPDLAGLYAEIYAQYNKPKVKLGPRPKASLDLKRPSTSGTGTQSVARSVSSLPPGLRSSNRKDAEPRRPKSRDASTVPSIAIPPPPPIPMTPEMPMSPLYHPKSPTSIRSLPVNTYSSLHGRSHGSTPEKQRLMKALQLRKKQMEARKIREEKDVEAAAEETSVNMQENENSVNAFDSSAQIAAPSEAETVLPVSSGPTGGPSEPQDETETAGQSGSGTHQIDKASSQEDPKPDMPLPGADTDDIHSAASACSPTSAQTQGSSVAPSTRPSSISEDDAMSAGEDKPELITELPVQNEEVPADNESTSAESTPTVVPEAATPVPHLQVSRPSMDVAATASEDTIPDEPGERKKKRESMILISASEIDEVRARRKSKRASIMLPLSSESLFDARSKTLSSEQPSEAAKEHRRSNADPLHLSAENSEVDYLSDDSFMEELQSAKVEEAMPMSVSKSPIVPVFPRKPASPELSVPKRSASQQHPRLGGGSPEQTGVRKLSGPWVSRANTDAVVVAKKINVGSGISQRIKALAEKSNRDSSASLSPVITPEGVSSTVAQRRSSFFTTPPDGNSPNGKSVNRVSRTSFINVSRSTTPEPTPASHAPRANTPTQPRTVHTMQQGSEQSDSVQVTARIIRDTQPQKPASILPTETNALEFHRSAITIDHQKSTRPPTSSSKHSATRTEPMSPRPPSSAQSIEPVANLPRSSSESSWRSFGRRQSESKHGGPPRSMSTNSLVESSSDEKPAKKEKKDSRTSKLFKRMSSISSITRKNSAPSIPEDIPSIPLPSLREPPSAIQLGDLNIQFPDTLLWKRRWVEIDASGNLVLSQSRTTEQSKGGTMRRFSLIEFRAPFAPDLDQQELPNSVVLDFLDGRTLQLACETYSGQAQVLAILSEAHTAWTDYNQGL